MDKNFKRLLILTSAIFITIIALCIASYVNGIGKDVVEIVVAPIDTTLTLDDSTKIKSGKVKFKTGAHTIKASRQDFEDQTKEFVTTDGKKNIVWFEMIPTNQTGIDYRDTHKSEFQKIYDAANGRAVENIDNKVANYPIIKYLPASTNTLIFNSKDPGWAPYDEEKFVINYGKSKKHPYDSSKLAIYITADKPAGKQKAISYIHDIGFDLSDYEVIFEATTSSTIDNSGTGDGHVNDSNEIDFSTIPDGGDE
jgi:hypothetical protein